MNYISKNPHIIITIDGPSGVGKSTIAKKLATILNKPYLNTGAMFRMMALKLGPKIHTISENELQKQCTSCVFQLKGTGESSTLLFNNELLPDTIYSEDTAKFAAQLALNPIMRTCMKILQRNLGASTSLIAEGRDLGTEIFPDAQYKFFLHADIHIRAKRRFNQLEQNGLSQEFTDIIAALEYRDNLDQNRHISPLIPAHNAFIIDSSCLELDEVIQLMLKKISK